ncbi:hypothetical protein ID866_9499, partial [Astraeus odoratus]
MSRLPGRLQAVRSSSPEPLPFSPPPIKVASHIGSPRHNELENDDTTTILHHAAASTVTVRAATRMNKRKLMHDDEDLAAEILDQPRKLPAIGSNNSARPLATSRTALNRPAAVAPAASQPPTRPPSRLTRPDPPRLGTATRTRTTRATSAPPKPSSAGPRPPMPRVPSGTLPTSTTASTAAVLRGLQAQVSSIESLQAASAQQLAREMDAERAKLTELTANHRALSKEL